MTNYLLAELNFVNTFKFKYFWSITITIRCLSFCTLLFSFALFLFSPIEGRVYYLQFLCISFTSGWNSSYSGNTWSLTDRRDDGTSGRGTIQIWTSLEARVSLITNFSLYIGWNHWFTGRRTKDYWSGYKSRVSL